MGAAATTRLVARREIAERLQGRLIRVMTAITALLVVAGIVVPTLVRVPAKPTVVGLVGAPAQAIGPALGAIAAAAKVKVRVVDVTGGAIARRELRAGSLDVALRVAADAAVADVKQTLTPTIGALLRTAVDEVHQRRALGRAGIRPATILAALAPVPFQTAALQPLPANQAARQVAAFAAGLLMYLSLAIYGAAVANGVAQEKTTRTAEVLLAAVRPTQLLAGKVVGIGLCGLGQLAVAAVAGLIANAAVSGAEIPSTIWLLLPSILLWFLLGYALYSFAFAAAGAMVARQEEVQFVTMPLTIVLIGGYLLVSAVIASPNAAWLRVLSFVPPFAPMLMPARIAIGNVSAWEMPLDVLITLAAIYGMARLAARIYAGALVRGGARLSWRSAVRLR